MKSTTATADHHSHSIAGPVARLVFLEATSTTTRFVCVGLVDAQPVSPLNCLPGGENVSFIMANRHRVANNTCNR